MSETRMIRFTDVGKTYARATDPVLQDINLDIMRGELVALIGPSGCGKSTLLNLLAGLTEVTTGSIEVSGDARRSAYVFQSPRLLPWRSLQRNVEFGLEQAGFGGQERTRRAKAALELVHLGDHGGKYPRELSGGMQQRAALARGLALDPELLLLDEPFSALDALTRSYLQEELLAIARRFETTALLVTHDIDEALLLADRIVVMSSRPARIREVFDVPFGAAKSQDEILADPRFVPLRHEIRALLRPDVLGGESAPQARPLEEARE